MISIKSTLKMCVFVKVGRNATAVRYLTYFKSQRTYRLGSKLSRPHDEGKIVFGTRAHADNVTAIF